MQNMPSIQNREHEEKEMKPSLDWEAMLIAALGLVVFFILMIGAEKAVGA
jgi:hypothetical protein